MMILDESKLSRTKLNISVFSRPSLLLIATSVHSEPRLPPGGKFINGDVNVRSAFKRMKKLSLQ